jgi:hypothetical protein
VTPDKKSLTAKKSKCVGSAQEIGFSSTKFVHFAVAGKGTTTQVCTSKKECNKLDLTVAQYF